MAGLWCELARGTARPDGRGAGDSYCAAALTASVVAAPPYFMASALSACHGETMASGVPGDEGSGS